MAIIGFRTIGSYPGGVESVITGIAPHIAELGWRVTLYVRARYWQPAPQHENVTVVPLGTIYRKHTEAIVHTVLATAHAARAGLPLLHYQAIGNGLLAWAPRLWGARSIVTVHGRDWQRAKWGRVATEALKLGERITMRAADAVLCVSPGIAKELSREYGRDVDYIPNAVDVPPPRALDHERLRRVVGTDPGRYFLWIGRIVPEKRVDLLVDGFKQLGGEARLVIAGSTEYAEDHAAATVARARGDGRIHFVGPRFGEEKELLLRGASCFVLPSDLEGMPMALLEAMSYGLPCIVADLAELRAMHGSADRPTALTFPPGDRQALTAVMQRVADDFAGHRELGARARAAIAAQGGWRAIAERWVAVYDRLLQGGRRAEGREPWASAGS